MIDETRLYAMVTKGAETIRHFKIGITGNLTKRLISVQTGCPTPITSVMSVILPGKYVAMTAEKEMHGLLADYHSTGEWFTFDTANLEHKAAFNEAARFVLDRHLGPGWTWSIANLQSMKRMVDEVRPKARIMAREALIVHAYRMVNRKPLW